MPGLKLNLSTIKKDDNILTDDIQKLARLDLSIEELLIFSTEHECSDLYIKVDDQPYISRYGKIIKTDKNNCL